MRLLELVDLTVSFPTVDGVVRAVDHVHLSIDDVERMGLIGETGCGKTVLGMSIIRLLHPSARVGGRILYRGRDLLEISARDMRRLRGKEIALIPQNPTTSLNPVLRVGDQIAEVIQLHHGMSKTEAWRLAVNMLGEMRIPDPERRARQYPHELSGGMRERVLITMALACNPTFIIADEPTKGLDSKTKSQILRLMRTVTAGRSMLMITHDLGVARSICDRIAVMYAGELLEWGPSEEIMDDPLHPYTRGLINSLPSHGLEAIPGTSPSLINLPSGCRFHPRCRLATKTCKNIHPDMIDLGNGRAVRCILCT
ncbi:MAG TPA: ABC transporter ATP-binding protein [Methanothrix sp.]|nr:ABC transporter ATP-binding protein [Methanothrix sp.]